MKALCVLVSLVAAVATSVHAQEPLADERPCFTDSSYVNWVLSELRQIARGTASYVDPQRVGLPDVVDTLEVIPVTDRRTCRDAREAERTLRGPAEAARVRHVAVFAYGPDRFVVASGFRIGDYDGWSVYSRRFRFLGGIAR
jgi:hypothetical protein